MKSISKIFLVIAIIALIVVGTFYYNEIYIPAQQQTAQIRGSR